MNPKLPSVRARICMSVIAVCVVYGNLAVTFNPQKLGLPASVPGLPRPIPVLDAFLIPGMFSGYTAFNFDFFLEGQRSTDGRIEDRGRFIELRVDEHFPQRTPITYVQVFAAHQWDMFGASEQRRAWSVYAQKIKARNNRMHPDAPITRVRFGIVTFPQSSNGYRAAKPAHGAWKHTWYADP